MIDRRAFVGMLLVCTAAGIGGLTVVMTRFVIAETDPYTLASVRYFVAALFLLAVVFVQGRRFRTDPRDRVALVLLALVFFAAFPCCFATALEDTTSARGALIYACMPLLTVGLVATFRIERITTWKVLGVVFAIAGVWSAIGFDGNAPPNAIRGDVVMMFATAFTAIYTVFAKRYVMKYDGIAMTAWSMLVGSAVLFVFALIFGQPLSGSLDLSPQGWGAFIFLAAPGGALMMWCFIKGFRMVTPVQAAVSVGCNPLTAIFFGAWIMGEEIGMGSILGFILIMLALFCANWKGIAENRLP
ncbi:MAG: DMT family transporter [Pseudomonadota bacterium]|nr:DMT family transporter [Pseudomonadota bacterium]